METSRTILFVDDVSMFRELGAVFLARTGRVLTASSGEEALRIAREQRPDLILTDLDMPEMDGETLCRTIKSDPVLANTPVIILMGARDAHDHARVALAGANDVLTKPMSRLALLESVNRFLRFTKAHGRPRVDVDTPVQVQFSGFASWGVARNISRGGIFLETPARIEQSTEVQLCFTLPDTTIEVTPTAEVLWCAPPGDRPDGVGHGMRFLELDGASIRSLEAFVCEHSHSAGPLVGGLDPGAGTVL